MSSDFSSALLVRQEAVDDFISSYFRGLQPPRAQGIQKLQESMEYSVLKGGKRFRPVLCLLLAEILAVHPKSVLPWAMAIEMIHTYSLIHDDLPCMDNDDIRRGSPTNHKVFGETMALLAGDALLTEAFKVIADFYESEPAIGLRLTQLLSNAAGFSGMVGGQAIDIQSEKNQRSLPEANLMHAMKTGALIRVCAEGVGVICGLPSEKVQTCRQFGENLGLAFQLKDDLLDSQQQIESGSFPALLGMDETKEYLDEVSEKALQSLQALNVSPGLLKELVIYNQQRSV